MDNYLKTIKTPFYVFDIDVLKKRITYLQSKFKENVRLCYAMKANPFVIKNIEGLITKYEICSYGEYKIAELAKIQYKHMVISGVYKNEEEMNDIITNYQRGEVITIESLQQIKIIDKITKQKKKPIDVILRLTSGNQFGMTELEIEKILEQRINYDYLNIMGIQYFSGTQKTSVKRITKEIVYVDNFVKHLLEDFGFIVEELELGLGLYVNYFENSEQNDENGYLENIGLALSYMEYKGLITLELGRSIVASCGDYYTKVVDKKTNNEGNFAILDGGMNHIVYYGQMMAMKLPKLDIYPSRNRSKEEWNLCGSLCTINDLLVKKMLVDNLQLGDMFIFHNTGAYSMTEGISLFLSRNLPKVLLKENNTYEIVREDINTYQFNMANKGGE